MTGSNRWKSLRSTCDAYFIGHSRTMVVLEKSAKMPDATVEIIENGGAEIYVSIASLWEIAIKSSIGKLELNGGIEEFIQNITENGFLLLGISTEHIKTVARLPLIHRDPFDRVLIAQAMVEDMRIMTTDANILKYKVSTIW